MSKKKPVVMDDPELGQALWDAADMKVAYIRDMKEELEGIKASIRTETQLEKKMRDTAETLFEASSE